nr:hypothetical protein [Tanacetum cinerariifolium]
SNESLKKKLETLQQEKEGVDGKLAGLLTASKDLDNLIESQRSEKNKEGLGYTVVPPPAAQLYLSPKKDLSWSGLPECTDDTVTDYSRPTPTIESTSENDLNRNTYVSETVESPITSKPFIKFVRPKDSQYDSKTDKKETPKKPPVKYAEQYRKPNMKPKARGNQRNWNNLKSQQLGPDFVMKKKACFNYGNISYLSDFEPYDGGYVSFGQGGCKITGKGTIKMGKLEFENVYLVKDLKYNLFSVSQICDNKNSVLFTDSECIVLGRDFKLLDDANILLRTPRQHNMYSIVLNNIVPHRDLTCLVAKASAEEVLVNKSHNKTTYELFNGRPPAIGFLKPFGCHVMILNTLDNLGKFEEKGDKGYFIGYSMSSRAFKPQDHCNTEVPEGSGNSNPATSTSNTPADQMETLTVETPIPTVSSPVLTVYSTDSQESSSDARLISKRVANQAETTSLDNILSLTNWFEDILGNITYSDESNGEETYISNMETAITASHTPTLRIHKDHPKSQIIGPVDTLIQTRNKFKETLVDCPKGVRPIGMKWVLKNKKDERGIVIRNKARLVAQGHTQEEGIDYDEVFAPVARIEDPDIPAKVYKAMYGLHQSPRAWYGTLSKYLLKNGFQRGTIDQTLFIIKQREDFILIQVYVDDIILGSSNLQLCREFEALMHEKFQMSDIGELNFFLGLQVLQKKDGIFLLQDKYVGDILKKFGYTDVRSSNTPMDKENPWGKEGTGKDVDLHLYRSMIGSLMYLTSSIAYIMFAVGACARHQVTPKECHLHAVKRIFRYLKGYPKLGLWYPKDLPFDLVSFSNSYYGGATQDRKSTTGRCQFLGRRLISWQPKK